MKAALAVIGAVVCLILSSGATPPARDFNKCPAPLKDSSCASYQHWQHLLDK